MSKTVFIILAVIIIVIETVFTPLFLKAQRPGKSIKSLSLKMVCATMFLCLGFLCLYYSGNKSDYARYMIIGLCLSWMGDLFLHIKSKMWSFAVGFLWFLSAHILYIIAYFSASKEFMPEKKLLAIPEIAIVLALEIGMFLFYTLKKKMSMKNPGMIASAVYGLILATMTVKAVSFSASYVHLGISNALPAAILLASGAISFCMSDTSLVPLTFCEEDKNNHALKNHNIGTYFFGQTLLALTILFIGV